MDTWKKPETIGVGRDKVLDKLRHLAAIQLRGRPRNRFGLEGRFSSRSDTPRVSGRSSGD